MVGGLMQLVAYGLQDIYLTGDSSIGDNYFNYLRKLKMNAVLCDPKLFMKAKTIQLSYLKRDLKQADLHLELGLELVEDLAELILTEDHPNYQSSYNLI